MMLLGVDLGGTKIAAGIVDPEARVQATQTLPTRAAEGYAISINQLWRAIDQTITSEVQAIGICAPGPLNPRTGMILNPPNLPGWSNIPLVQLAREKFHLPVFLENDCNAAALAETRHGAARGSSNMFYAAIGTGIGAGIVINGKIHHGAHGVAGEAGHITIDYQGPTTCGCGTRGCIEALASGAAIAATSLSLDTLTERLAAWLGGIVSLLDPEIIVLGGGVSQLGDALFEKLRTAIPKFTINPFAGNIPIVPAHFGLEAGIVGASLIARESIYANSAA